MKKLTGARTEELRALTWDHVDLDGQDHADPPIPPSIDVRHSTRDGGDTKTRKSAAPSPYRNDAYEHYAASGNNKTMTAPRPAASATQATWSSPQRPVRPLDAHNVRRAFRKAGNGYLVYADGDGFHALQFAQP